MDAPPGPEGGSLLSGFRRGTPVAISCGLFTLGSMIKVRQIDHVAIAVADLGEAAGRLGGLFGLRETAVEHVAAQKTDVVFLHASGGDSAVELICPSAGAAPESAGLRKFLDKRGPGLH